MLSFYCAGRIKSSLIILLQVCKFPPYPVFYYIVKRIQRMLNSLFYPPNSPPLALALAVQEITLLLTNPLRKPGCPIWAPVYWPIGSVYGEPVPSPGPPARGSPTPESRRQAVCHSLAQLCACAATGQAVLVHTGTNVYFLSVSSKSDPLADGKARISRHDRKALEA